VTPLFRDRRDAGRALAQRLAPLRGDPGLLVLGLPRGGIPVAFEVAQALQAPLDVLVVRKIGHPAQPEFAIGAIAGGGVRVMNTEAGFLPVDEAAVAAVVEREQAELARREALYRGTHPALPVRGRHVVVIDDGLATGATMQAAVRALRSQQPDRITVAVPVGAAASCSGLHAAADEVVCAHTPQPFRAVGLWYAHFPQTEDDEVRALLGAARREPAPAH
jgi:putative phosphoribosyl transferase